MNQIKALRLKHEISTSLEDISVSGYWFCKDCQHITKLNLDREQNACVICESPRVQYHAPIFTEADNAAFHSKLHMDRSQRARWKARHESLYHNNAHGKDEHQSGHLPADAGVRSERRQ